jgi:hypothetical protein
MLPLVYMQGWASFGSLLLFLQPLWLDSALHFLMTGMQVPN